MRDIVPNTTTVIRSQPLEQDVAQDVALAAEEAGQAEQKKQEGSLLDGSPDLIDVVSIIGDAGSLAVNAARAIGGAVGDGCKAVGDCIGDIDV
ncbi:hypothetical protein ACLBXM_10020 [Xanthobacteraceae bacterium A53D]